MSEKQRTNAEGSMIRLEVPKLHCDGCAGRVTRAVQGVDPLALVTVDLNRHALAIDSDADESAIRAALDRIGYPASAGLPA